MKIQTKFFLSILILSIFSSCNSKKYEDLIVGNWTLNDIKIVNIDELSQNIVNLKTEILTTEKTKIEDEIAKIEDTSVVQVMQEQLNSIISELNALSTEKVKSDFEEEFKVLINEFVLDFKEDFTFHNEYENSNGNWEITEQDELIITEEENKTNFSINEIDEANLSITLRENQGEMNVVINMVFSKNE